MVFIICHGIWFYIRGLFCGINYQAFEREIVISGLTFVLDTREVNFPARFCWRKLRSMRLLVGIYELRLKDLRPSGKEGLWCGHTYIILILFKTSLNRKTALLWLEKKTQLRAPVTTRSCNFPCLATLIY